MRQSILNISLRTPLALGFLNLVFCGFLSSIIARSLYLSDKFLVIIFFVLFAFMCFASRNASRIKRRYCFVVAPLSIALAYFAIWYDRSFGGFDLGAILFHFQAGHGDKVPPYVISRAVRHIIFALFLTVIWLYYVFHFKNFRRFDALLAAFLFVINPVFAAIYDYVEYQRSNVSLLDYYVEPKVLGRKLSDQSRNLIIIYAESTERTFGDLDKGSIIFSELKDVASKGAEVIGLEQVSNTGWSVAGLVASQCGVPLQPSTNFFRSTHVAGAAFLPRVMCLGDVLKPYGYQLEYISGGSLDFAGMDQFLYQHNYAQVFDARTIPQNDTSYRNTWGYYDDDMFSFASDRLEKLQESGKPFVLSVATIAGHAPRGEPSRACTEALDSSGLVDIAFAIKCTGYHIHKSLDEWETAGLLRNTNVVVVSDHLIMRNRLSDELNSLHRLNYFTILGQDIEPRKIYKQSATFDVFPTLLELLGVELVGRRAGIGRSLLSPEQSVVEEIGLKLINTAITNDRNFSAHLWRDN